MKGLLPSFQKDWALREAVLVTTRRLLLFRAVFDNVCPLFGPQTRVPTTSCVTKKCVNLHAYFVVLRHGRFFPYPQRQAKFLETPDPIRVPTQQIGCLGRCFVRWGQSKGEREGGIQGRTEPCPRRSLFGKR